MKFLTSLIVVFFLFTGLGYALDDGPYYRFPGDTVAYQIICNDSIENIAFELRGDKNIVFRDSLCSTPELRLYVEQNKTFSPEDAVDYASKIFVISDFHGEFNSMRTLLVTNSIITKDLHWNFGDGRLVIDGDMMDRGDKVTDILWLIYHLEQEADSVGGKVHFLLGNHEIMVMQGDLRYINPKYDTVCTMLNTTYDKLYSNQSFLGQWLRSKPVVMRINDILFVHGGISPVFADSNYSINFINEFYHEHIDTDYEQIKADSMLSLMFGSRGPTWYRGYLMESNQYPQATQRDIEKLLTCYHVNRIVVGHTVQDSIMTYDFNKIVAVNIDYENPEAFEGLLIENGVWSACNYKGEKRLILMDTTD